MPPRLPAALVGLLSALLATLLVAPASAPAAAASDTSTRTAAEVRMATKIGARIAADPILASHVSGIVRDAETGRLVWSRGATTGRMPASTNKVPTAMAALIALGPDTRLTTRLMSTPIYNRLVLQAGGDPELRSSHLAVLADRAAVVLKERGITAVSLRVDDSIFAAPSLAPGWRLSYYPDQVAPVRGLIVDQREVMDTALDAGQRLAAMLETRGIDVVDVRRERGAAVTEQLAAVQGWTVRSMVQRMLNVSDNDTAEYLARLVALDTGRVADWAGARAGVRATLRGVGLSLDGFDAYDGSGLSRSNRVTAWAMARFVRYVQRDAGLSAIFYARAGMPISGVSGTLDDAYGRYDTVPTRCARGEIAAKTGSLTGAIALAGRTVAADGRMKIFSFIVYDRANELATKRAIDKLATTVNGCW